MARYRETANQLLMSAMSAKLTYGLAEKARIEALQYRLSGHLHCPSLVLKFRRA
jgi:hypothetical protein